MSDLVILLIIAAWAAVFSGYVVLCDRVGR
jgi:hypothetical protein